MSLFKSSTGRIRYSYQQHLKGKNPLKAKLSTSEKSKNYGWVIFLTIVSLLIIFLLIAKSHTW